jgi:hypothetical protein
MAVVNAHRVTNCVECYVLTAGSEIMQGQTSKVARGLRTIKLVA